MHRTIEAILHPDGTIELLEPLPGNGRRRALLTILEETPASTTDTPPLTDAERLDAALRAAGLLHNADAIPATLEPLSTEERAALAQRNTGGTPLSQIIIEEREERF
jgi:hypothetical protein